MSGILDREGSETNRSYGNRKVSIRNRKSLILAGLGLLCLLAGCARKEPGPADHGAEGLEETLSVESGVEKTPPAEPSTEGNLATEPPIEGNLPAGQEGSSAGGVEQDPPVLTDVLYDKKQLEASGPITIQFLFSDGAGRNLRSGPTEWV